MFKIPSFAHIIIGLGISIFLYKITEGKFSTRHALVFTINNLVGPDLASFFPTQQGIIWAGLEIPEIYFFFHGYGWFAIAALLVIPWNVFIKFLDKGKEKSMKMSQTY